MWLKKDSRRAGGIMYEVPNLTSGCENGRITYHVDVQGKQLTVLVEYLNLSAH
jgi:hypothetical protein